MKGSVYLNYELFQKYVNKIVNTANPVITGRFRS